VVWESAHQFRVLTARYVELIWRDRRGLRLLLLQAPVVAAFLLLGFLGQDYRSPMPILRRLTADERHTLEALRGLNEAVEKGRLSDEQRAALREVRLAAGQPPLDLGADALLSALGKLARDELTDEQAAALGSARFPSAGGEVSALEMVRAWKRFQHSDMAGQLLRVQGSVVPERTGVNPRYTYMLLFITVMVVLWFGCNNASKEVVKEEPIYARERAVNLHILPYLASKFVVLSAMTMAHAAALVLIVFGTLELCAWQWPGSFSSPPPEYRLGYVPLAAVLAVLSMTGVALGLFLSACVTSEDRASALLPYVLIPQMILGGGVLAVSKGVLFWLAALLSPVYWAYRASHTGASALGEDFPMYSAHADDWAWPCVALASQAAVLLLATAWVMKRKDA
jgi:hypothetical protein